MILCNSLKTMDHEQLGLFVTSILELKLDMNTLFEWQKHNQTSVDVPHYNKLLEFINLRAQASETTTSDQNKKLSKGETHPNKKSFISGKPVVSFGANTTDPVGNCVLCKMDKHPLYTCPKFKNQPDADRKHLTDLQLANPTFRQSGRINVLLGGQWIRSTGSPVTFKTVFSWVLAGSGASCYQAAHVTSYHTSLLSGDNLLQKFWETEEPN